MGRRDNRATWLTKEESRGLDEAMELDRAWFEAHPGEWYYSRPPVAGEFLFPDPPGLALIRVAVVQLAPGVRVRHQVFVEVDGATIH